MADDLIPEVSWAPPAPAAPLGEYYAGSGGMGQQFLEYYTPAEWRALRAETLNKVAKSANVRQQTIAGEGAVLPIVYGSAMVGARIFAALTYGGNKLVLGCAWCVGEVDAVAAVYIGDAAPATGVTVTHYTGTASQTADPTLIAAFAAAGKTYADALPGVCYSVFSIPASKNAGFPICTAQIRGLKVAATSGGTPAYSDCPAFAVADFIESTAHGMRRAVDWASVATVAAANDTLYSGEKARLLNLALDSSQPCETWLAMLCDYAGCRAIPEGDVYRLVPDTTGSSVMSFDATNMVSGSLKIAARSVRESPTAVEVVYTDTTGARARDATVAVYAPGVLAGSKPRRMSRVSRPGTTRYSEAYRVAVERLNASLLNDLSVTFEAFDAALAVQVGDIVDVTHSVGLSAKLFRVAKIEQSSPGRWSIAATEYDPAVYSSTVATGPSVVDTTLDNPSSPPTLSPITLAEEVYQLRDGTYASRVRATWAASTYSLLNSYRVTVWQGGAVVETGTADRNATTYATGPVREGVQYQVDVAIATSIATGTAASATITPAGKSLVPGDVASLTGFEAGGRVFLYWTAAADLDIWRYELRYGTTGGSWDTATVVTRVDALTHVAEGLPAGTWRFYVKAIDSVGQYSNNAAWLDVVITSDAGAFLVDSHTFTTPTLANMTTLTDRFGAKTYVTDFGDGLGYGADDTDDTVGTFGDSLVNLPLATPHTAGTSSYTTESWDAGSSLTGNFTFLPTYTVLEGSVSVYVQTSPDNSTWTDWIGGSGKTTARYVRGKLTTTGAMLVHHLPTARIDVVPRRETGTVTTSASAAVTVTLGSKYAAANSIQLTPTGTAARTAIYDNVVVSTTGTNSFDVYLFNSSGTKISGDVSWLFLGI